ncbi:MAG TPA: hypothetical protein VFI54_08740 [Solirubrobacteraceae bacterium]|nr:hypothetical protein [Solirubrobacteraceae bacterium]
MRRRHGSEALGRVHPVALVTAETDNQLVVVDLNRGRVLKRIAVAAGPQYVAPERGVSAVVSTGAGALTLLEGDPLRVAKVLRDFDAPHVTAMSPDGEYAYVTDDSRGTVTAIQLSDGRVTSTIRVGPGARFGQRPRYARLRSSLLSRSAAGPSSTITPVDRT